MAVITSGVAEGFFAGRETGDDGSIYEIIRNAIIAGELAPGTPLVEGALAKQHGVSRSPIREAMVRLRHEGLLERRGRAMTVRVLRAEDVLELYEVRIALEVTAARAAAERRTELDLGRLREISEAMDGLGEEEIERRPVLAHAFHFVIWQATHNAILAETLDQIHLRVMGLSSTTLHYPERWAVFTEECRGIVEAIARRDAVRAGELAEQQMVNARDYRVKLYSAMPGGLPDRYRAGRSGRA